MHKLMWLLLILALGLNLAAAPSVEAAKPVQRDVAYILGMYYGNGSRFLIRENLGRLELVYCFDNEDRDFSGSNIFPLKKEHFDSYTLDEDGPLLNAEAAVRFERNSAGRGITCSIGGKRFTRYFYPGQNNNAFRFPPSAQAAKLKQNAAAAVEPVALQQGTQAQLVNLLTSVSGAKADLRYAAANNCFGQPLYTAAKAYAAAETAAALNKAAQVLQQEGYGLLIWEAYRPWSASKLAWDLLPADKKSMLAAPEKGDIHNTGLAVDVSLYSLQTGQPAAMISDYDEVSPRQFAGYTGGTTEERHLRDHLRQVMVQSGFKASKEEWWHFSLGDGTGYAHLNVPLSQLN